MLCCRRDLPNPNSYAARFTVGKVGPTIAEAASGQAGEKTNHDWSAAQEISQLGFFFHGLIDAPLQHCGQPLPLLLPGD